MAVTKSDLGDHRGIKQSYQIGACGDGDTHLLQRGSDFRGHQIQIDGEDEVGQTIDCRSDHLVVIRVAANARHFWRFDQFDVLQQMASECP